MEVEVGGDQAPASGVRGSGLRSVRVQGAHRRQVSMALSVTVTVVQYGTAAVRMHD